MVKYTGKKLLVLGGAFQHCKVVEAARRLGVIVYVADYLIDSPAKEIADHAVLLDVNNVDKLVELCTSEKIDGVISTSLDPCQIPYQRICERLNMPCFGSKEQFQILTNKEVFKEYCRKYDVDTIISYQEEEVEEGDLPVLVKPVDSRGSRGQTICRNKSEIKEAVKLAQKESSNGKYIIEKYMDRKDDFTISYLFIDGEAFLVRTGDRYQGSKENGLDRVAIAATSPSKYSELFLNKVHEKLVKMLKGIGMKNGPVFIQGFVDGDKVRFYDPGLRFSGGEYERLLQLSTGVDLISLMVKYALSISFDAKDIDGDVYELCGNKIVQLCPTLRGGKITQIIGVEELKKHKDIITYSPRYKIGDYIYDKHDVSQRFAEICILSKSIEEEIETIKFIQNTLHVLDDNNKEMLIDCFDTQRLKEKNG